MPDTEHAVSDTKVTVPDTEHAVPDTTHTHFALSHLLRVLFLYSLNYALFMVLYNRKVWRICIDIMRNNILQQTVFIITFNYKGGKAYA